MKHFLIYKTTNLINGKYYYGKHETSNLNDGYIGSGVYFKNAVDKYGYNNFKREIIYECCSREEMNNKEKAIITQEIVDDPNSYNLKIGGEGGWDYCNKKEIYGTERRRQCIEEWKNKLSKEQYLEYLKFEHDNCLKWYNSLSNIQKNELKNKIQESIKKKLIDNPNIFKSFLNKKHSKESILKIKKSQCNIDRFKDKNPIYGKIWICNNITKQSKLIDKNNIIPDGWIIGKYKIQKQKIKKIRIKKDKNIYTCLNCNNKISNKQFCNNKCRHEYEQKQHILEYIELEKIGKFPLVKSTGINRNLVKRYLLYKNNNICSVCHNSYDNLVVNTINGNPFDTNINNFRLLCKECYNKCDTSRYKNRSIKNNVE